MKKWEEIVPAKSLERKDRIDLALRKAAEALRDLEEALAELQEIKKTP